MTQTPSTPQAGSAGDDPQPQVGTTPQTEPQAGDDNNEPISQEAARKLRSEANALRKSEKEALAQLKVYQDKEQQAQEAEKPEIERLKKQGSDAASWHNGWIDELVNAEGGLK